MTNKIILVSLYKNDHDIIKEHLPENCQLDFYDSAKQALELIEGYSSNIIILLSTLIEDIVYEEVIDQIKLRSKKAKIIVYSSFASIDEITTGLDKGVYDFIIGDDVLSKVILAIHSIFQKSEFLVSNINDNDNVPSKRMEGDLFEIMSFYQNKSNDDLLNKVIEQYNQWYQKKLTSMNEMPILIIEDEAVFRKLLIDMIATHYTNITAEAGGIAGLKRLKEQEYGIAIIDLFLDDMDGVELIQLCKAQNPMIEIIIVTAFDLIETASNVLKLGVSDYLQKPIIKQDLINAIIKAQDSYKNTLIQKKALSEFFGERLDFEEKCTLLEGIFKYKKEKNKPFIMEDLYHVFPDLNKKNIYKKIELPPIITKENLRRFILSFNLDQ